MSWKKLSASFFGRTLESSQKLTTRGKLDEERSYCFAVRDSCGDLNRLRPMCYTPIWCQPPGLHPHSWCRRLVTEGAMQNFSKNSLRIVVVSSSPYGGSLKCLPLLCLTQAFLGLRWQPRRLLLYAFKGRNIGCGSLGLRITVGTSNRQTGNPGKQQVGKRDMWG